MRSVVPDWLQQKFSKNRCQNYRQKSDHVPRGNLDGEWNDAAGPQHDLFWFYFRVIAERPVTIRYWHSQVDYWCGLYRRKVARYDDRLQRFGLVHHD